MKKMCRLVLVVLTLPLLIQSAVAITSYVGQVLQDVNIKNIGGTAITTGNGATDTGTQRVALSSDSLSNFKVSGSTIQVTGLGGGAVIVDGSASTQPISAATLPLPIGAATSANQVVEISTMDAINNKLPTLGQKPATGSVAVIISTDQTTILVQFAISSTPTIYRTTATTTSSQIMAANANRVGLECESSCDNNKRVYLNFGASATSSHKHLEACSSWQPPAGVRVISSLHVLAESGSQVVICTEY
jgi:hypothetical protein